MSGEGRERDARVSSGDAGAGVCAEQRPPYVHAAVAAIAVFFLYVLTLAPTTAFWDTSEYIATAHILGIPHPPGNPLFVALARSWEVLLAPSGLSVAVRINLFAAATSALAGGFFFLVAHRILRAFRAPRWVPLVGAGAATLIGATAYTVWHQSNVNEKVYTLSVMVIAAVSWLVVRWMDRAEEPGSERYLLGALYLMVLGSTSHLMSVLPLPAAAVFVVLVAPGVLLRGRFWARALPLVIVGLSFNFFLPIRAAEDPVINEGDPTCESAIGAAVAIYTNGRTGCPALASSLTREQYAKPPLADRQAPLSHQLGNFLQYFDWQWARGLAVSPVPMNARFPVTLLFVILGLFGLWTAFRADPHLFAYLGTLALTLTLGLVFYLNFEYGYSLAPDISDPTLHEVRERDYFFVAAFLVWGVLTGVGLARVWGVIAEALDRPRAHVLAAPVLALAFVPLVFNWGWADRSGDFAARDWAYDLLMSVEPYGVLFTNGDNDTFPLWYVQEVEGIRSDVTVIVVQYLYTDWYPRQLQELTRPGRQRAYTPVEGVPEDLYGTPPAPTDPIITASGEQMDRVGSGRLGEELTVPMGRIAVQYPSDTFLDRGHRLALRIIRDSIDERPIHFANTTGLMGSLGIERWGVRQGLATRLVPIAIEDRTDTTLVRISPSLGGDWVDLDRSLTLVDDVYVYGGLAAREIWPDRSTLNIPWHFYVAFVQLADAVRVSGGDPATVEELQEMAALFRITALGGSSGTPESETAGP